MKLGKRMLSASLSLLMAVQLLGVAPAAAAEPAPSQQAAPKPGVFVEYFDHYNRRVDYTTPPESWDWDATDGDRLGHGGIPDEVPVTWCDVSTQINSNWLTATGGREMKHREPMAQMFNMKAIIWSVLISLLLVGLPT